MATAGAQRVDMQKKMEFLREDLTHLFDDQGIDQSAYDEKVNFEDPITRYSTVKGYMFNISMLRRVFAPTFQLHDIKQTSEFDITTRWTMSMQLALNRYNPFRKWWDPQLLFTGTSIMSVNPSTGRFNSHVDTWDAVQNQKYLSLEAVRHLLGQLATLSRAPRLESPQYTVLKKPDGYAVRKYNSFLVAETGMTQDASPPAGSNGRQGSSGGSGGSSPGGNGTSAFMSLAGYIFGKNDRQEKMAMTMPVFSNSSGRMQFFMGHNKERASLPTPNDTQVQFVQMPGGFYAVRSFSGKAGEEDAQKQLQVLYQKLARDKLQATPDKWTLARYNDPSTKGPFRLNEVLVEVVNFDLWGQDGIKEH
ncbi:hypothetical protein ABBQ32_011120 [Trebouxia sp. C0010 RCD-2024]